VDASEPEPEAAVDFYRGLFGWEFEDAAIGSIPEAAPATARWNTYFWVDSADEAASKIRDAGGGVVIGRNGTRARESSTTRAH
jgi:uncharacterized protein